MIIFRFLFISVFAFFSIGTNAQFIIAGSAGPGDYYKDVVPDSALDALPVHLSNHPGESMDLDVDSDGVFDINIATWGGGGLGGGGGSCNVWPLHTAVGIVAYKDTFIACCPSDYMAIVADTLLAGDMISTANPYHDTVSNVGDPRIYIWSTTYGQNYGPGITMWNDIGEHFIGFRLKYSFDTLYGWIRVDVTYPGLFVITIKDFACNRNTHIGIREPLGEPSHTIFPNPVGDKLTMTESFPGSVEVRLYSALSSRVGQAAFDQKIELDVSDLAEGFYFYLLLSGDHAIAKGKFLKR